MNKTLCRKTNQTNKLWKRYMTRCGAGAWLSAGYLVRGGGSNWQNSVSGSQSTWSALCFM